MLFYLLSRFALQEISSAEDIYHESENAANNDDTYYGSDAQSGPTNSEEMVNQQVHIPQEVPPGTSHGLEQATTSNQIYPLWHRK